MRADAVTCRASNVDIAFHACTLAFGKETVRVDGRKAHELFATLVETGVSPEGAAGSTIVSAADLHARSTRNRWRTGMARVPTASSMLPHSEASGPLVGILWLLNSHCQLIF